MAKKKDTINIPRKVMFGIAPAIAIIAVLFLITIWPAAMDWVHSVNPWYFLVAFVILVARPFYRFYLK